MSFYPIVGGEGSASRSRLFHPRDQIGSFDEVWRLVEMLAMVNSTADFLQHPAVING